MGVWSEWAGLLRLCHWADQLLSCGRRSSWVKGPRLPMSAKQCTNVFSLCFLCHKWEEKWVMTSVPEPSSCCSCLTQSWCLALFSSTSFLLSCMDELFAGTHVPFSPDPARAYILLSSHEPVSSSCFIACCLTFYHQCPLSVTRSGPLAVAHTSVDLAKLGDMSTPLLVGICTKSAQ